MPTTPYTPPPTPPVCTVTRRHYLSQPAAGTAQHSTARHGAQELLITGE